MISGEEDEGIIHHDKGAVEQRSAAKHERHCDRRLHRRNVVTRQRVEAKHGRNQTQKPGEVERGGKEGEKEVGRRGKKEAERRGRKIEEGAGRKRWEGGGRKRWEGGIIGWPVVVLLSNSLLFLTPAGY